MDPTLEAAAEVKLKSFLIYRKQKKNTLVRVRLKRILIFKGKIKKQPVVELNTMLGTRFLSLRLVRKSLDLTLGRPPREIQEDVLELMMEYLTRLINHQFIIRCCQRADGYQISSLIVTYLTWHFYWKN